MNGLTTVLAATSLALTTVSVVAAFIGHRALGCGLAAGGAGLSVLYLVITDGSQLFAALNTAVFIWSVWQWWNGGGGDGTRRRLRRLARAFRGVRRTAPAAGAA